MHNALWRAVSGLALQFSFARGVVPRKHSKSSILLMNDFNRVFALVQRKMALLVYARPAQRLVHSCCPCGVHGKTTWRVGGHPSCSKKANKIVPSNACQRNSGHRTRKIGFTRANTQLKTSNHSQTAILSPLPCAATPLAMQGRAACLRTSRHNTLCLHASKQMSM